MKVNRKVKIFLGSIAGIVFLLFLVLVVHIATAKPVEVDNATMQISRIDFKEPLDSLKSKEIHRNLKSIQGVKNIKIVSDMELLAFCPKKDLSSILNYFGFSFKRSIRSTIFMH